MKENKEKTILLVDNEKTIRELLSSILRQHGYKVYIAENSELAYNICLKYLDEIDILLTDIYMPKLTGDKLAELLLSEKPNLKVIFSTGNHYINIFDDKIPILYKPYTIKELLSTLEKLS